GEELHGDGHAELHVGAAIDARGPALADQPLEPIAATHYPRLEPGIGWREGVAWAHRSRERRKDGALEKLLHKCDVWPMTSACRGVVVVALGFVAGLGFAGAIV